MGRLDHRTCPEAARKLASHAQKLGRSWPSRQVGSSFGGVGGDSDFDGATPEPRPRRVPPPPRPAPPRRRRERRGGAGISKLSPHAAANSRVSQMTKLFSRVEEKWLKFDLSENFGIHVLQKMTSIAKLSLA